MKGFQLSTPVAFIIFNRPDMTARVFEAIRQAEPPQLLVIADGPRPDQPGDVEKCAAARSVVDQVDWPCEVLTNYSEVNLGCKRRVSSGLDWVFETVEEAIILEDDCLPHPSFFRFCEELLERYRDDERVAMISGDNFQFGRSCTAYSYYFSRYTHIWGWASWRRAWNNYDVDMELWPQIRDGNWLNDLLHDGKLVRYWTNIFERVYRGEIDTWDYQWAFVCLMHRGFTILPSVNLVSNIGFAMDATHTDSRSRLSALEICEMKFPLKHPPFLICDSQADKYTFDEFLYLNLVGKMSLKICALLALATRRTKDFVPEVSL